MNRSTILNRIHHHLQTSFLEWGEERPLGEIVPLVARDIRPRVRLTSEQAVPSPVISIEKIAAFVDGNLDKADEQAICDAMMMDNSVLAEVIASVRASENEPVKLPPLPGRLHERLLSMHGELSPAVTPVLFDPDRDLQTQSITSSVEPYYDSDVIVVTDLGQRSSRLNLGMAIRIVAVAAVFLLMVSLWIRWSSDANSNSTLDQVADKKQDDSLRDDSDPTNESDAIQDAIQPTTRSPEVIVDYSPGKTSADISVGPETTGPLVDHDAIANASIDDSVDDTELIPRPDSFVPNVLARDERPRELMNLNWTEVIGLMVKADASSLNEDRPTTRWEQVQLDSSSQGLPENNRAYNDVVLRTLPMSRATGDLAIGGKMVMAPDTGVRLLAGDRQDACVVDLMFGTVALLDVAEGTELQIFDQRQSLATLHWVTPASLVVQRLVDGLQIQVHQGDVLINNTSVRSKSVHVKPEQELATVRAPKRLPRWISTPDQTTVAEQNVLAQFADSGDLRVSLQQNIAALSRGGNTNLQDAPLLSKLAQWQAALAGPHVFRLTASRIPAVRIAALNRLVSMPESDPRYARLWRTIEASVNNQQRFAQSRRWLQPLRSGTRPNRILIDQMLAGLAADDVATRALADFVLRKYVNNAPPYDPTWTAPMRQRAINIYRQRAGLAANRPANTASGR